MNPAYLGLVAALLVLIFMRPLLGLIFGGRIARTVMAKQPDTIHLQPASSAIAAEPAKLEQSSQALIREGFTDAGWFTIAEMPGVVFHMLVHPAEGWQAILCEHPKAGRWLELVLVFPDRSRLSFVGRPETGLAPVPNFHVTYLPGLTTEAILRHARAARAKRGETPVPVTAAGAAAAYEQGFAEVMAQRKAQGLSRAEIAAVAMRGTRHTDRAA